MRFASIDRQFRTIARGSTRRTLGLRKVGISPGKWRPSARELGASYPHPSRKALTRDRARRGPLPGTCRQRTQNHTHPLGVSARRFRVALRSSGSPGTSAGCRSSIRSYRPTPLEHRHRRRSGLHAGHLTTEENFVGKNLRRYLRRFERLLGRVARQRYLQCDRNHDCQGPHFSTLHHHSFAKFDLEECYRMPKESLTTIRE